MHNTGAGVQRITTQKEFNNEYFTICYNISAFNMYLYTV